MFRAELIPGWECEDCDEDRKKERNCACEHQENSVYYHPLIGELTACPRKYIPSIIYWFIDEYDYYEKYPSSAPKYSECNPRYWLSVKEYEKAQYKCIEFKKPDGPGKDESASAFKAIKNRFINRG